MARTKGILSSISRQTQAIREISQQLEQTSNSDEFTTLKRLVEEITAELGNIRTRVDNIEGVLNKNIVLGRQRWPKEDVFHSIQTLADSDSQIKVWLLTQSQRASAEGSYQQADVEQDADTIALTIESGVVPSLNDVSICKFALEQARFLMQMASESEELPFSTLENGLSNCYGLIDSLKKLSSDIKPQVLPLVRPVSKAADIVERMQSIDVLLKNME